MTRDANTKSAGFSLIETMVAAVILGLAITGVMSMLPIGATIEAEESLRLQARMIATSEIEQAKYHNSRYATVVDDELESLPIQMKTSAGKVVNAYMTTTVSANPSQKVPMRNADGLANMEIPYKIIRVEIHWTLNSESESITLQKFIAEPP